MTAIRSPLNYCSQINVASLLSDIRTILSLHIIVILYSIKCYVSLLLFM